MCEKRDMVEKNDLNINIENNIQDNDENKVTLNDLINDPSINNLTSVELKSKILTIEEEMKNEIQKIKEFYKKKIFKYKISLQFLKEYQFLKNLNEYKDYTKFANRIKQKIDFTKEKTKLNKDKNNIYKINTKNYY